MMKLSTSTNILCERPGGTMLPLAETLEKATEAGFTVFDMSFYEWAYLNPHSPFLSDDWEAWIHGAKETADRLGVSFYQSHAHTYDFMNPCLSNEEREYQEMLVKRSLDCCRILGATYVVTHPGMNAMAETPIEDAWQKNREYLSRFLEYADKRGMMVAVENMVNYSGNPERKFFSEPEEIIAFIDTFGDSRLGVCWDFEHGEILKLNQPAAVRLLGHRLMATHVSDTTSREFELFMHVMPFTGLTEWKPIMEALRQINYQGAFSYEAHNFAKKLPDELVVEGLKFSHSIGEYLMTL